MSLRNETIQEYALIFFALIIAFLPLILELLFGFRYLFGMELLLLFGQADLQFNPLLLLLNLYLEADIFVE